MGSNEYRVLLPEKLLPFLKAIEKHPPNIKGFRVSRLYYLVSLIMTHRQKTYIGSYSELEMKNMKNIVPRANEYLKFLKGMGLIEWKNYLKGRNCRLYRIRKEFEGPAEWRTLTDMKLIYRIDEVYRKLKKQNSRKYPVLNSFVYCVRIDKAQALREVENIYNTKENPLQWKQFAEGEIQKIEKGQIYIKVNKTNGRYDTNFTRLPSELVPYLTIDNRKLLEIDIANSQPFFAGCLFKPAQEIKEIMGRSLFMYILSLELNEKQDIEQYVKLVCSGGFYEFMMREFDAKKIPYEDKRNFKKQLFVVFFGNNQAKRTSRAVRLFADLFPTVQGIFEFIKRKQYNQLAILLQRIEAFVMLERVAPAIIKEFPGLPFITKHDSLLPAGFLVPGDEVEKVKATISRVIEETTGLKPLLRVKIQGQHPFIPLITDNSILYNNTIPLCVPKPRI